MLLLVKHWAMPNERLLVSFPDPIPLMGSVERDYMTLESLKVTGRLLKPCAQYEPTQLNCGITLQWLYVLMARKFDIASELIETAVWSLTLNFTLPCVIRKMEERGRRKGGG